MKYIFLCIFAFLIILPTKLGFGQIRSQQTQVCGFIRDRNGFPLSNSKLFFEYRINPRDGWQSASAKIDSVGFYCINGVPKELFESRRGSLRVLISGGISSSLFIREGAASAFYSGSVGNRVIIDIKVDSRIYYPSPSPTPSSTATPIATPIATPSPSPTIIPSPTPIRTVTPTPTPQRTPTPTKNVNTNTSVNITPTPTINPSPSPLLPPSKIDELLAKMNLGNIAFVAPDTMTLNKPETVYLKIGIAQTIEELEKEIKEQGLNGQIHAVKGVRIDSQMQAVLMGGDDFKITPITPDTLPISHQTTTEWEWDVKPLRGGNLRLYLALNAIVEYEDGQGNVRLLLRPLISTIL